MTSEPTVAAPPAEPATAPSGASRRAVFHPLTVTAVRPLTADAVQVTLEVPDRLADTFAYSPGQHIPVRARLGGETVRRNYSICAAPVPGSLTVAIKRAAHGLFSRWAVDELRPGDTIEVMAPEGRFTIVDAPATTPRHFAAVAAGSGITPVIGMIAARLAAAPNDTFTLVYSNKTTMDAMFVDELADLKDRHPDRLQLFHVLTRERRNSDILSGRLDADRLRRIFKDLAAPASKDAWFLCGPLELVQLCREELAAQGVPRGAIRFELFATGAPGAPRGPAPAAQTNGPEDREAARGVEIHTINFRLDGTTNTVTSAVNSQEPVLNAALRVRGDVPYACAGGVCGTCRARVLEGSCDMAENYALEPEDVAAGLVLTCQAIPTSPVLAVDYDTI
jgi:ring-1,2-phenylacetyl-CoA epoxidase subunit PaaE